MEYGEPKLYFHFCTTNGLFASLPMTKETHAMHGVLITGIPGTFYPDANTSVVTGYRCACCRRVFYAPDATGLKHECMNNGGVISGKA